VKLSLVGRKTPGSIEKRKDIPAGLPFVICLFPLLLLRRSGFSECVFTGAGVVQAAIGCAGELAGAGSLGAFHLAGAARHLPLILTCLQCAIFHGRSSLIGVENLVAAVKRFRVDAPGLTVVSRNVSVLGKRTLFARRATDFSLRGAFSLREHEVMARLVTGRDTLLDVGLAALAGHGDFRLRRSHRNGKSKYRTAAENLMFHVFLLRYGSFRCARNLPRITRKVHPTLAQIDGIRHGRNKERSPATANSEARAGATVFIPEGTGIGF